MAGKHYSNKVKIIFQLSDLLFLNLAFIISSYITTKSFSFLPADQTFTFLLIINLFWSVLASNSDLYLNRRIIQVDKKIYLAAIILTLHCLIISFVLAISNAFDFHKNQLVIFYVCAYYLIFSGKIILLKTLKYFRRKGFNFRTIVILGGGKVGGEIRSYLLADYSFGFKYMGVFDDNPDECKFKSEVLGSLDDFKIYALQNNVDEVFIALPDSAHIKVLDLMHFCDYNTIRVKLVPDFTRYIRPKIQLDFYGNIPIILLRNEPLESIRNRMIKRGFDIVFSLCITLFILTWFIPLMGLLIKLHSKGPVFFIQRRTGLNNKVFNIIKFRTMRINKDADKLQAHKGDPRITNLGSFLRKSNIDELPQFINVLIGNMSVIGPRPHMIEHTLYYSEIIDSYMVRHFIKPGLTGWAQVNGYRGDTTNPAQMEGRVKFDVYYIENWSIFMDIRIILKTIYNIFKGEPNAV